MTFDGCFQSREPAATIWVSRIHQKKPADESYQKDSKRSKNARKDIIGNFSTLIFVHHFCFPRTWTKSKISGSSLNIFSEMVVCFTVMNPMVESVKNRLKQTKASGSPKILFHAAPLRLSSFCASTPWGWATRWNQSCVFQHTDDSGSFSTGTFFVWVDDHPFLVGKKVSSSFLLWHFFSSIETCWNHKWEVGFNGKVVILFVNHVGKIYGYSIFDRKIHREKWGPCFFAPCWSPLKGDMFSGLKATSGNRKGPLDHFLNFLWIRGASQISLTKNHVEYPFGGPKEKGVLIRWRNKNINN